MPSSEGKTTLARKRRGEAKPTKKRRKKPTEHDAIDDIFGELGV